MKILTVFFLLIFLKNAHSTRNFLLGHRVGGNLPPPVAVATRDDETKTAYFTQQIDHFNPVDTRTFQQQYHVNTKYFNSSIVFLNIGGEGKAQIEWMTQGAWIETAKKHDALLFQLEHRYYGNSQPFSDWSTGNLQYLSSLQAIEDLAVFVTAMNEKYELPENVKWIAFGGSYSGALAAWFRSKYPHLITGAMSASGPVLALLDYHEYLQVVVDDLATHSQDCVDAVQAAILQLDSRFTTTTFDEINSLFNPCQEIDSTSAISTQDVATFYELIADNFAEIAQYNNNNRPSVMNINTLCDIMTDVTNGTELQRLATINGLINSDCLDYKYESIIATYGNITVSADSMMRQWVYQTCTEFGYFQTSSQKIPIFGDKFPVDYFTQLCVDLFGSKYDSALINSAINYTNTHFGAKNIRVSNVVFVHGSFDPWYPLGITKTIDEKAPAIFINGTAHCANMYTPTDTDSQELKTARDEVNRLIDVWLTDVSAAPKAGPVWLLVACCAIFLNKFVA